MVFGKYIFARPCPAWYNTAGAGNLCTLRPVFRSGRWPWAEGRRIVEWRLCCGWRQNRRGKPRRIVFAGGNRRVGFGSGEESGRIAWTLWFFAAV